MTWDEEVCHGRQKVVMSSES